MFRLFLSFFILYFTCQTVWSQNVIILNDSTTQFICSGEYLEILEDKEGEWTIEDVSEDKFRDRFILNKSNYPYNENTHSTYWIKFRIKNNSKTHKGFLLESYAPHTNNLELYYKESNKFIAKRTGLDINFYSREYINKNLILDLPLDTGRIHIFYVRVESSNHSSFDFRIKPRSYFFFYSVNEYYSLGIFYGILVIMAIYNLLIFISTGEKVYLYYIFYILAGIITTLADDGLGYQYIWTNYPELNSLIGPHIAPPLLLISFILYSREFLNLNKSFPLYDKIILGLTLTYLLYTWLKFLILPIRFHSHIFYILPFIAVYIISFKCFLSGMRPVRFFITGFSFILVSIIIIKLRSNGTIEGNLFTVYSLNYGLVLEALVLSFAMADRYKFERKEREIALKERNSAQFRALRQFRINKELQEKINQTLQEKNEAQQKIIDQLKINEELRKKVNRELESKVSERTKELHAANTELNEANIKLQELTEKANQMSIKLDVDNWELKKKVKEEVKARMKGSELSYEEFKEIFPNEHSCLTYLYELKWSENYNCLKCKSVNYHEDFKNHGRKCLRCGYFESATAHTLFHRLKFPITKAFYIVYIVINKKDKVTLDELSDLLSLGRNSCWKFKNKIADAIEIYKTKNRNSPLIKSWEDIIFVSDSVRRSQKKRFL